MTLLSDLVTRGWRHRPKLLVFLVLAAVSLIAYANALPNSFHFDDIDGIVLNPSLRDLRNIPSYFTNPTLFRFERIDWRPFLQITYALDYAIGGLNPALFRFTNLLFHIGAAFLIFLIVTEMDRRTAPLSPAAPSAPAARPALIAAALFALHTANAETVNYVWARSSLLAAFFYLLSFYCFLRGPLSDKSNGDLRWHLGSLAAFALGLGTKVTVVTLPITLVLCEILFLNPKRQNPLTLYWTEPWRLKKYIPAAALLLAYIALRVAMFPRTSLGVTISQASGTTAPSYLLTQFRAWVYYLRLYVWPHPLILDFPGFGWSYSLSDVRVLLSLGLIVALLAVAWWLRQGQPLLSFFIAWFFIALLPEASFFPLRDAVVGYRPYLAYVGLSVAAAILSLKAGRGLWDRWRREDAPGFWRAYSLGLGIILAALTAATIARNLDWRDQITLWSDVLRKDPTNARAYMSLGLQHIDKENYEEAEAMLEKAVRLAPSSSRAYMFRGYLNLRLGRYDQALSDLNAAIELRPGEPFSFLHRGELYRKTGRYAEALSDYQSALRLNRRFPDAYFGIALVYWEKKELQRSTAACRRLLELDPYDRRGYSCLGSLLMHQSQFHEALKAYSDGVTRFPNDGYLWYGLATAYEEVGLYQEAQEAYAKSSLLMR